MVKEKHYHIIDPAPLRSSDRKTGWKVTNTKFGIKDLVLYRDTKYKLNKNTKRKSVYGNYIKELPEEFIINSIQSSYDKNLVLVSISSTSRYHYQCNITLDLIQTSPSLEDGLYEIW